MLKSQKITALEKYRDYATWKMESIRGSKDYLKAKQLVEKYNKEIQNLKTKKTLLKQLSLF